MTPVRDGRQNPRIRLGESDRQLPLLTPRQAQAVGFIRSGVHSAKELSYRMGQTYNGTHLCLERIYERLGERGYAVDNLTGLAIFAFAPEVLKQKE